MTKVFKYRANLEIDGERRDTMQLLQNTFYAAKLCKLNDPFEGSVMLPKSEKHEHWVTPLIQDLYNIGIYSLSKPKNQEDFPDNELLWSHYANSHKGFCIVYDLDKLMSNPSPDFDIRNLIHISYENKRPEVFETDDTLQIQKKVFGTKSLAWQYENEVRLVFLKDGLKPVAKDAVQAIYFGLNISLEHRRDIIDKMSGKNIDYFQIERIENTYQLKASKLTFDYSYDIINFEPQRTVDNYLVLYKSPNKDKITIIEFVGLFRQHINRPANITIIDDLKVQSILSNYSPRKLMSSEEIELQSKHWIAYSSFDAPECVTMYPER